MNDDERASAYDALRGLMIERGYDWVVSQAEEEIREGKTLDLAEPVRVKLPGRQRTSRIESGTVTVSFTPLQRLEILVAAVRRATVVPAMLEEDVVGFFAESSVSDSTTTAVAFGVEPTTDVQALTLAGVDEAAARAEAARALSASLDALIAEARR